MLDIKRSLLEPHQLTRLGPCAFRAADGKWHASGTEPQKVGSTLPSSGHSPQSNGHPAFTIVCGAANLLDGIIPVFPVDREDPEDVGHPSHVWHEEDVVLADRLEVLRERVQDDEPVQV